MTVESEIKQGRYYHYFQPIYNLFNWKLEGYEVLLRSDTYLSPEQTFQAARKEKMLYELDISSIYNAVYYYQRAGSPHTYGKLYINVFLSTILNPFFPSFLNFIKNSFPRISNMVLEINGLEKTANHQRLTEAVETIREAGFQVALDNVGEGNIGIRKLIDTKPDIIKLDKYFAFELDQSEEKQMVLELLKQYCDKFGIKLILEGIENPMELATAKFLNIPYGQGYLLAKPRVLEHSHSWKELPGTEKEMLKAFYR